jgi:hypothetical protein
VADLLTDAWCIEKLHRHPAELDDADMGRVWRAMHAQRICDLAERIKATDEEDLEIEMDDDLMQRLVEAIRG